MCRSLLACEKFQPYRNRFPHAPIAHRLCAYHVAYKLSNSQGNTTLRTVMAGTKRKAIAAATTNDVSKSKRIKQEDRELPLRLKVLETATDSDPIIESDTTEHSGDDDGESWPSDREAEETEQPKTAVNEYSQKENPHETSGAALPRG